MEYAFISVLCILQYIEGNGINEVYFQLIRPSKPTHICAPRINVWFCHTRLHLGFSAELKIWQVPTCKMEPQIQWLLGACFDVRCPPPIGPLFRKYVQCPPLPVYTFLVRCPHPLFSSVPWTLWLCLVFWAKLRILQVPAWRMKPSSTCIRVWHF